MSTRRAFLAASAASFAAAAFPLRAQSTAGGKKLGVALVGIGSLTMGQILPAFAKASLVRPVALVSGHPEKAGQQAAKYHLDPRNIYTYDTFDTIKDNPDVDIVYVVLPNSMHAEYTIRAAKAGKHVLCEKPMANTPAECQSMIDACKAAGKKLMIAYRLRYEPMTQKAIELAQSMGTLQQISAEAGLTIGDPTQWRLNKKLAGGGPLMDMGIYAINAIRYLSKQEPSEVAAMISTNSADPRFKEVEETISFLLRFPSGMLASVLTSYNMSVNRVQVCDTSPQFEVSPFQTYANNHLYTLRGRDRVEVSYTPVNHFAAEMDHFAECITSNKQPLTPGEEGLQDMKVIAAAYQSAAENKPIKIV